MAKRSTAKVATTDAGARTTVTPSKEPLTELQSASAAMPRLSRYQKFTPMRIARRDITSAAYNPRSIDPHARKKLTAIIRSKGLVSSITWNKRTGNLVGGHQRLVILDALEGSAEYSLDVDAIDVSPEDEIEHNIILNNPSIQGTYDVVKLEELFKADAFDWEAVGFDSMDMQGLFPDSDKVLAMFDLDKQPEDVQKAVGEIAELQELQEREKDRVRAEKKAHREKAQAEADTEWHCLLVFANREEREHFMDLMGRDPNERYLDARVLMSHLEAARLEKGETT